MELPVVTELGAIGAAIGAVILLVTQAKKVWSAAKIVWRWGKEVFIPNEQVEKNRIAIQSLEQTVSEGFRSVETNLTRLMDEVQGNGVGGSLKKALRHEVEQRWRMFDLDGRAVWETGRLPNGEFGCVRASQPLVELVGTSPYGTGWMNALHEDDRDEIEERWEEAIRFGQAYDQLQRFIVRDARGHKQSVNYCRAHFKPEYDDQGQFCGGIGTLTPITEDEFYDLMVGE